MNDSFQTPQRKINTIDYQTEQRYKYSTIQSRAQKNSKFFKESDRWQHHQQRRQNRMSSLLKARKEKLQEITGQNRKIFIRINKQQSHYPTSQAHQSTQKYKVKENASEKLLGPIGIWQGSSCFIAGARGIMCDRLLSLQNAYPNAEKKSHGLPKLQLIEKQNILQELILKTNKKIRTPYRQRNLSDLYMLI